MNERFVEVDALKAVGIVTVILIHGVRPPWDPSLSDLEVWIGHLTRFAVPAFLFCSGSLYATAHAVPWAVTGRRLRRVLVPYLVASAGAQLWIHWRGIPSPGGSVARDLLFGASFGPYYYVFVIAGLILLTPLLARIPRSLMIPLTGALIAVQWMVDAAVWLLPPFDWYRANPFFWHVRNPLLWWGYFALGWVLRVNRDTALHWIAPRRGLLVAVCAGAVAILTGLSGAGDPFLLVRSAAWLHVYAVIALVFVWSCGQRESPAALRFVSDASYGVYLFHLFFLYAVQLAIPPARGDWISVVAPWAASLAGSLALVAGVQRLLGRRSRDWIGA